ncbi:MAG TPA: lamin tail domain-containing protein, partial [Thermoplasmatales archaeon]|nr:lamin tail domain-containing protein [Thermoplasmatales archaeon]
MYKKSVIKKMGSIVVVAAMLASAFTVMSVGNAAGASSANVAINEIMYNPASGNEWVELFNSGDSTVNLTGWVIKDAANNTFGDLTNVEIPPGEYVVVNGTGAVLNNDNDEVHLFDDSMTEVDNATYDSSMGAD